MNSLISISDGLRPSIFRREVEGTRPMREEMDGKFVHFSPEWAFQLWFFSDLSTFPYLYLELACKHLCWRKGII